MEQDAPFFIYGESRHVALQIEKPCSMISQSRMRTATDKPSVF